MSSSKEFYPGAYYVRQYDNWYAFDYWATSEGLPSEHEASFIIPIQTENEHLELVQILDRSITETGKIDDRCFLKVLEWILANKKNVYNFFK